MTLNKLGQRVVALHELHDKDDDSKSYVPKHSTSPKPFYDNKIKVNSGLATVPIKLDLMLYDNASRYIANNQTKPMKNVTPKKTSSGLNYMMGFDDE